MSGEKYHNCTRIWNISVWKMKYIQAENWLNVTFQLEDLKKSIEEVWDGLEIDLIRKLVNSFPKRLIKVVAAKRGHTDNFWRDKNWENWYN